MKMSRVDVGTSTQPRALSKTVDGLLAKVSGRILWSGMPRSGFWASGAPLDTRARRKQSAVYLRSINSA